MRRVLTALLFVLVSAAAWAQVTVVSSTSVLDTTNTPTINTSGATLLVGLCGYDSPSPYDTYGNTWITYPFGNGTVGAGTLVYAYAHGSGALATGTADSLSCIGSPDSQVFIALSGTLTTSSVLDSGPTVTLISAASDTTSTITSSTVTPSQAGDEFVFLVLSGDQSASSGIATTGFAEQQCVGGAEGSPDVIDLCVFTYTNATTAALAPSATLSGDYAMASVLVAFKASGAGSSTLHTVSTSTPLSVADSISATHISAGTVLKSASASESITLSDSITTAVVRASSGSSGQQLPLVYIVGM